MEMGRWLPVLLAMDALVVLVVGLSSFHGEHGWDFLLINGLRLTVMGAILLLCRLGANTRVQEVLFHRRGFPGQLRDGYSPDPPRGKRPITS